MVDVIKRGTIRYYLDRRKEIIEILAHGEHSPDYVKMLEGARDMANARIQQLTDIRVMGDVIVPLAEDRRLESLLRDVIGKHLAKCGYRSRYYCRTYCQHRPVFDKQKCKHLIIAEKQR